MMYKNLDLCEVMMEQVLVPQVRLIMARLVCRFFNVSIEHV